MVLAYGAWVDGPSWGKVIAGQRSEGARAVAAPLPLASLRAWYPHRDRRVTNESSIEAGVTLHIDGGEPLT